MKTIGIYCFYSSKGIISKETIKQIIDFRNNLDYLILIINGKMENYEDIDCADRIIQRDNVGFDAGAYKDVLIMPEVKKWYNNQNDWFYVIVPFLDRLMDLMRSSKIWEKRIRFLGD